MEAINRNAKRLKRLVDIVFEISQLENDLLLLNKGPINFKELITDIMINYQDRKKGDRKYIIVRKSPMFLMIVKYYMLTNLD